MLSVTSHNEMKWQISNSVRIKCK